MSAAKISDMGVLLRGLTIRGNDRARSEAAKGEGSGVNGLWWAAISSVGELRNLATRDPVDQPLLNRQLTQSNVRAAQPACSGLRA